MKGLEALTGANHGEVVAMNSLTMNLHLILGSFYRPTPDRFKVLVLESEFPSDLVRHKSQRSVFRSNNILIVCD